MYTIVVASVEMTGTRKTGRNVWRDANWFPEIEPAPEARACVWLNVGTQEDVEKARAYCAKEGGAVFLYPTDERDPIGRARNDAMRQYESSAANPSPNPPNPSHTLRQRHPS